MAKTHRMTTTHGATYAPGQLPPTPVEELRPGQRVAYQREPMIAEREGTVLAIEGRQLTLDCNGTRVSIPAASSYIRVIEPASPIAESAPAAKGKAKGKRTMPRSPSRLAAEAAARQRGSATLKAREEAAIPARVEAVLRYRRMRADGIAVDKAVATLRADEDLRKRCATKGITKALLGYWPARYKAQIADAAGGTRSGGEDASGGRGDVSPTDPPNTRTDQTDPAAVAEATTVCLPDDKQPPADDKQPDEAATAREYAKSCRYALAMAQPIHRAHPEMSYADAIGEALQEPTWPANRPLPRVADVLDLVANAQPCPGDGEPAAAPTDQTDQTDQTDLSAATPRPPEASLAPLSPADEIRRLAANLRGEAASTAQRLDSTADGLAQAIRELGRMLVHKGTEYTTYLDATSRILQSCDAITALLAGEGAD